MANGIKALNTREKILKPLSLWILTSMLMAEHSTVNAQEIPSLQIPILAEASVNDGDNAVNPETPSDPNDPMLCEYNSVALKSAGFKGVLSLQGILQDLVTTELDRLPCFLEKVNQATETCNAKFSIKHESYDLCILNSLITVKNWWHFGGTYFIDTQCNAVPTQQLTEAERQAACSLGALRYAPSPISLVLNNNSKAESDIERNIRVVQFPLDPARNGSWYTWKASENSPLLVYDPQHRGVITSAFQLFGEWTFGGKRSASLIQGSRTLQSSMIGEKWEHGFEALATLDRNQDAEISGDELEPLALWLDRNQDGVSQSGEVQSLKVHGIVKLFYSGLRRDAVYHEVVADLGYERMINAQISSGKAIDWYADSAPTKAELISQLNAHQALCGSDAPRKNSQLTGAKSETGATSEQAIEEKLQGIWQWKSENSMFGDNKQAGFLLFTSDESGKLLGTTISLITPEASISGVQGLLHVTPISDIELIKNKNTETFQFTVGSAKDGQLTRSTAIIAKSSNIMKGQSKTVFTEILSDSAPAIEYTWTATRMNGSD